MSAPHGGGGGGGGDGGYGGMYRPPPPPPAGWMPQPIQQAPTPTRLPQTPIRTNIPPPIQTPVYSTGYPAQQMAYNQYVPGQVSNTAPPANSAMMYQHNHHGGQHRAITHSPVQRQHAAAPGPDIPTALIALADTYIGAAHSTGYKTALGTGEDARAYSKLVATGLGCLEGVLQYRLQPRMEAMVRLRYAAILFEETENLDEAEETLNKGILLAQRNNLLDLKCNMQYLLVRIMFNNSHKAALKMLNAYLSDVETLDIPLWTYSFRFLRFSLLAEPSPARDDHAAIHTLQRMGNMAQQRRDAEMLALSSIMEVMVSLRNGADGGEAGLRALTRVTTLQNGGATLSPQLEVLAQFLDICCSLTIGTAQVLDEKIRRLHAMLDQPARWASWRDDGEFEVRVNPSRPGRPPESLKLRWLNKDDIFTIGYFLSGLCKFQKNVEHNGRAERFLMEGLATVEKISKTNIPTSLEASQNKLAWRRTLKAYMYVYYTFLLCMRTDWDAALKYFKSLTDTSLPLNLSPDSPLAQLITYLHAVISHGTNDLYGAFNLYSSLFNTLPHDSELSIICRLNTILILRIHNPPDADMLMRPLEKQCTMHKNEMIKAAYLAVKATERGELVKTKNHLSLALQYAVAVGNVQLTFIVLNFMCSRFFSGVVSEQAEKSAKAAMQNAKKGRDTLWTLMGGQMYADCLERKGEEVDAMGQKESNLEVRAAVIRNLTRNVPMQQQGAG